MNIMETEKVNAFTHGVLVPVMAAGTVFLDIIAGKNTSLKIYLLIFGFSAITLFSASFLYHAKKKCEDERSVWRKLDRSAIFILIAGTYTPLFFLYLKGTEMWIMLAIQWLFVLSGFCFSFFTNASRKISTIIYLSMGLIPFKAVITAIPSGIFVLFITGGMSYAAGSMVYAFKKPNLSPHIKFHELFHLFVIIGALCYFLMIIKGVNIYINQ